MNMQDYSTPLFEWVLTYWIHSTVLFFAVFLLLKIPYFKQNNIKDTLWKIALIGGLITTTFQVNLGIQTIHLASYFQFPATEEVVEMPLETIIPVAETEPRVIATEVFDESKSIVEPTIFSDSEIVANPTISPTSSSTLTWEFIIIVGWLGISIFLIGRYLVFHLFFFKKLGKRQLLKDTRILHIVEQILSITNIQKKPQITYSKQLNTPIVIGNSEICLPERAIDQLTTAQQQSLIAHEVAHIIRKDYYWLLVARLLETIFFFQPLNRIIRKEMQITAEHLCDSWASRTTGNALALAECLVEIASWITQKPKSVLVSGMALRKSELSNRIYQLINQSSMKMKNLKPREYLFLTLMLTIFMVFSVPRISLALEKKVLETVFEAEAPVWDFQQQPMKIIPKDTVPKTKPQPNPTPTPNPIPTPNPQPSPNPTPTPAPLPELPEMPNMENLELKELVKAQEIALKAQEEAMIELKEAMKMQQLELGKMQEEMKRELKAAELEMKQEYQRELKERGVEKNTDKEPQQRQMEAAEREIARAKQQMERQMKQSREQMERQQAMAKQQMERQQKQMKRQMELQQRQIKMDMKRAKEQMAREQARIKQEVERAKVEAERHQAIVEAEMKEHNKKIDAFKEDTANELVKDGIIEKTSDFKSLYVKKGLVKVNGKKLTDAQSKKYISMIEKHFGASHRSHFQFNH